MSVAPLQVPTTTAVGKHREVGIQLIFSGRPVDQRLAADAVAEPVEAVQDDVHVRIDATDKLVRGDGEAAIGEGDDPGRKPAGAERGL